MITLPETNVAPENGWLEDEIFFWEGLFLGAMLVSGRVMIISNWNGHEQSSYSKVFLKLWMPEMNEGQEPQQTCIGTWKKQRKQKRSFNEAPIASVYGIFTY